MKPSAIARPSPGKDRKPARGTPLRRFHRLAGMILFIFIVNAAVTGLMRANAAWWYWKNRPSGEAPVNLKPPSFPLEQLYGKVQEAAAGAEVRRVELKPLLGEAVYTVHTDSAANPLMLFDAMTGEKLSPLAAETARRIASLYVPQGTPVLETELLDSYLPHKAKKSRPVYRIHFGDAPDTEVFVDRDTGEVLNLLDRGRRFGLWMVKLHELDFADLRRPALTLLGLGTVILAFTGLILGIRRRA